MTEGHNRLAVLVLDIQKAHNDVTRGALAVAEQALAAGRMLIEAKATLPHGGWNDWLTEKVGISARTARRYMQLARSGVKSATVANMGIRGAAEHLAWAQLSVPLPPFDSYAFAVARQWAIAMVWRCREQTDRFHVVTAEHFDEDIPEMTATRHPVPRGLVGPTLAAAGWPCDRAAFQTAKWEGDRIWTETWRQWAFELATPDGPGA